MDLDCRNKKQNNEVTGSYEGARMQFFSSLSQENEATRRYMAERTPEESLQAAHQIIKAMYRKELESTAKPYTSITFLSEIP